MNNPTMQLSDYDESTGASWLWAFLFGPIYYAVHGFWGRAAIVLVLDFVYIGIIVSPFLAYPAWQDRAQKALNAAKATAAEAEWRAEREESLQMATLAALQRISDTRPG